MDRIASHCNFVWSGHFKREYQALFMPHSLRRTDRPLLCFENDDGEISSRPAADRLLCKIFL